MYEKEAMYRPRAVPTVRVIAVNAAEQTKRIQTALARRAYEIFEHRGGTGGNELEDWRQAESELLRKPCYGLTTRDHIIEIGTDISGFEPGSVELWVAPQKLTICGKPRTKSAPPLTAPPTPSELLVFREVRLPVEVDPAGVETRLCGRSFRELEIQLPKVQPSPPAKQAAAA